MSNFGKIMSGAVLALVFVAGVGVRSASATSLVINLTSGNSAISSFGSPYATVTIADFTNSNTATVTFQALSDATHTYLFGANGALALNVNGAFTLNLPPTATSYLSGFGPSTFSDGGAANENGFGSFNLTVDNSGGFTSAARTVTFTITKTSGTWTNPANVLTFNSNGALAAAHIFVCSDATGAAGCQTSDGAVNTGYASGNDSTRPLIDTPEPGSLFLLGTGLLGAAMMMRRRLAR